jgi:hypothetical protein
MDDYSERGRAKLEMQAGETLDFIRCPLDSAAMLVTRSVAGRYERGKTSYRDFDGLPRGSEWTVASVFLECSACRRRAEDITVNAALPEAVVQRH